MPRAKRPDIASEILRDLPEITARISYIDTLQIWLAAPLSSEQLETLRSLCGGVSVFTGKLRNRRDLRRRYLIQQPSASAIEFLRHKASYVHLINRFDVALDLTVADPNEAQRLYDFFLRLKVQKWHGRRRMAFSNRTAYASKDRRAPRNLVQYADKMSKVTGTPCVHLELRLKGAEACRRVGINFLEDIPGLSHRKLWAKELCLRAIDPQRLLRGIDEAAGRMILRYPGAVETMRTLMGGGDLSKREAASRRIRGHLRQMLQVDGGPEVDIDQLHLAPAQRWLEVRPAFAKRCLVPIPSDQFLPNDEQAATLIK